MLLEIRNVNQIKTMPEEAFREALTSDFPKRASQGRLIAITDRAVALTPPALEIAKRAAQASTSLQKPCLSCEMHLAYIDVLENGTLTADGKNALLRSYELSPYGPEDVMQWRLRLSSSYWSVLSKDLQQRALMQITALSESRKGKRWLLGYNTDVNAIQARINLLK